MTGIGDSIMEMAADSLRDQIPGMVVDAKVSRQMWTLDDRITELLADDRMGDVVVVALGTNGTFQTSYLNSQLDRLGTKRRIVLVDVDMPDSWESEVNRKLKSVASERSNVTLADWHALVEQDSDLLGPDNTHPTTRGSREYAELVRRTVLKALA